MNRQLEIVVEDLAGTQHPINLAFARIVDLEDPRLLPLRASLPSRVISPPSSPMHPPPSSAARTRILPPSNGQRTRFGPGTTISNRTTIIRSASRSRSRSPSPLPSPPPRPTQRALSLSH
eukprot:GABV01011990.1.p1 GENE.GABV01011990.1~~GABV01011990.1.p1  ORF type:complete len:120 (+),score=16.12 GABV01011990.1:33-392(+)